MEELSELENESLAKSAFVRFIRILNVEKVCESNFPNDIVRHLIRDTIVRLLPRLESLAWLELGDTGISPALVAAIDAHPTLKTAAIDSLSLDEPFLESPVNLEKLLLWSAESDDISIIQRCNIRVLGLDLNMDKHIPPMESLINDLYKLSITGSAEASEEQLERFHALVAHHPSLRKVKVHVFRGKQYNILRPHLSSFQDAVEAHSLGTALHMIQLSLTPVKSTYKKGLDGWEITELSLRVSSSWVESLALVAAMFPKLVSLQLTYAGSPVHVDSLVAWISKHFPTLRMLHWYMQSESLIWTPLLIDLSSEEKLGHVACSMFWLAVQMFQVSPSLISIQTNQRPLEAPFWSFWASYQAKRDFSGSIIGMKIESSLYIPETETNPRQTTSFRGSVALSKMNIQFRQ
ncbi:hypothetical protein C8J56DRAFT_933252 [Mycena floridula]|nr:hypothetical protein C8J56DRAFT_933252 [Mycena floridula]